MKLLDIFGIGQESIDFQNNSFGKELENVFQVIADLPFSKEEEIVAQFKIFDAIILKHTGIKTKFYHDPDTVGKTYFDVLNVNHVLVSKEFKNRVEQINSLPDTLKKVIDFKKKNTVNLKTGKVTGVFTEFECPVLININFFKKWKITPEQMTAILLHEVGHLFTMYEFIDRQTTTNQVLAAVSRSVNNKDNIKQREFIFNDVLDILDNKTESAEKLANQTDLKVVTAVCLKLSVDGLQSQLGVSNYDYSSCEQLADQYCTRQGYGRQHIEIQNILGKIFRDYETDKVARFYVNQFQLVTTVLTLSGTVLFGILGLPIFSLLASLIFSSILINSESGEYNKDYKYDNLKVRFLRIREDCINYLKNKELDPVYVKKALADIEVMDKIIKDTTEARFVFDMIIDFVIPSSKKIRDSYELQRNLETLAMNDFFVKSATLATI